MKTLFITLLLLFSCEASSDLIQNLKVEKIVDGDTVYGIGYSWKVGN